MKGGVNLGGYQSTSSMPYALSKNQKQNYALFLGMEGVYVTRVENLMRCRKKQHQFIYVISKHVWFAIDVNYSLQSIMCR
jgi:hypothetical protein